MKRRHIFIGIGVSIAIMLAGIFVLNIAIIGGGIFSKEQDGTTEKTRAAAFYKEFERINEGDKPTANVTSKDIKITTESKDGLFRVGTPIKASCVIKNTSEETVYGFKSLLRTPNGEIDSAQMKSLKSGAEVMLKGEFVPKAQGVLIFACRTDVGKTLSETDENDNREIGAVYVFE